MAPRRFRKVAKDKKTGVPKKYLAGAKNKAAKAAEIKRTSEAYKRGETLDIKAIQKSRVNQDGTKKKTTKRKRKKKS
tara:strand:+ start:462 stop:692 length:231 start_codon:yes stop_codon:yes gene_type:complete